MAGVNSKAEVEKVDLEMTCCLGDHPLQNPKLLPCQHSICADCIKDKVGEDRKLFICPKCQLSIPLNEKDVDQLPGDILYELVQKRKEKTDCMLCKFENKNIPGTFQCLDCGDVVCDTCQVGHTRSSHTRLHKLVPVKDIESGKYKNEIEASTNTPCPTHSKPKREMSLEYYCEECKCLACQICVYEEHKPKGHTCKTIDEIHDEKTKVVTDHVTKLFELKQLDEEFAGVLDRSQKENKEMQEKLENEVHIRASMIMDIVEKVKEDKLTEIRSHFRTEDKHFERKSNEIKNNIIRTDSVMCYTQAFLKHSTKSEFLQHENEINNKLTNHMKMKTQRNIKRCMFELSEAEMETTKAFITDQLGKLKVTNRILGSTVEDESAPRKWMKEPKVLFSEDSGIGGTYDLTVTENEDIVAVYGSTIQVYNSEGKPKERINCSQLQNAWNVVAKGDMLYVSNCAANGNVLVIDFKGNIKKTITLPETSQGYSNKGLAVDDEGNVYISSYGTHTIYKCDANETKAKVFIPKGTHPDLNGPWYLCVTPNGEVVVSNHSSHTVQVYDRHGEFLWQYKGQGDMTLKYPSGVCCVNDGYIYISDYNSHRVQVIKNGEFKGCVKVKDFTHPYGIDLDKDGNIVCGYDYGRKFTKIKAWE